MTIGVQRATEAYDASRLPVVGQTPTVSSSFSPQNTSSVNSLNDVQDTVQLSNTAQQYLQDAQKQAEQVRGMVAQLVNLVAAGDTAALSLLTVA